MHAQRVDGDAGWLLRRRHGGGAPGRKSTFRAEGRAPRPALGAAMPRCSGHALDAVGIQGDAAPARALAGSAAGRAAPAEERTAARDAGGIVLRRQLSEIPPPPPPYPHYTQMFFGAVPEKIGELEITCGDLRERGFWIYWNTETQRAFPGEVSMGEPAPRGCTKPAHIELGPMPRDRGSILVAGWFHNHPPVRPGCEQVEVGPSQTDKQTSKNLKLPGMVQDFMRPGPNTDCMRAPRGTYFFGRERREV